MSKQGSKQAAPQDFLEAAPQLGLQTVESTVHPEDRLHSGLFGYGEVVELLRNADGNACGQRIRFDNGMEADLLITSRATRH